MRSNQMASKWGTNFLNSRPKYSTLDDEALLMLIANDCQDAFQQLVERHIDHGYAVAQRILQDNSEAEDVVQEAFMQVWNRRGSWKTGKATFPTWLFRVVKNKCIDLLRKNKPESVDTYPEIEDQHIGPLVELERLEASEILEKAMTELPEQQWLVVKYSYSENLSNAEIAALLDTSIYAVESLLKRGRKNLRLLLKDHINDIQPLITNS